jgi:hypothetical protein
MSKEMEGEKKPIVKEEEVITPAAPPQPPLESAARRLDRLLGGGDKDRLSYSNPAKVVRRWLGTSSGATGKATLGDISLAAASLLDPNGLSAPGRSLLTTDAMDEDKTEETNYLSSSSAREVEAWLLSNTVRLYWTERKYQEAYDLCLKSISIVMAHIDAAAARVSSGLSSLFPLLARLYRYRSLLVESVPTMTVDLRQDMVQAHGNACMRRDVDTQATLLNLMLHDLLNASQGKLNFVVLLLILSVYSCIPS